MMDILTKKEAKLLVKAAKRAGSLVTFDELIEIQLLGVGHTYAKSLRRNNELA